MMISEKMKINRVPELICTIQVFSDKSIKVISAEDGCIAAESMIRDTDVADEMLEQSDQEPQGTLNLLQ